MVRITATGEIVPDSLDLESGERQSVHGSWLAGGESVNRDGSRRFLLVVLAALVLFRLLGPELLRLVLILAVCYFIWTNWPALARAASSSRGPAAGGFIRTLRDLPRAPGGGG